MFQIAKYNKNITAIGVGFLNRTSHNVGILSTNTIGCFQLHTDVSNYIENKPKRRIIESNYNVIKSISVFEDLSQLATDDRKVYNLHCTTKQELTSLATLE